MLIQVHDQGRQQLFGFHFELFLFMAALVNDFFLFFSREDFNEMLESLERM